MALKVFEMQEKYLTKTYITCHTTSVYCIIFNMYICTYM